MILRHVHTLHLHTHAMILRHVHTLHLHAHAISLKRWKQIFGSSNGIPYTLTSILGLQGLHIACYFGVL